MGMFKLIYFVWKPSELIIHIDIQKETNAIKVFVDVQKLRI